MKDLTHKFSDGSIPYLIDSDTDSKLHLAEFEALDVYHERANRNIWNYFDICENKILFYKHYLLHFILLRGRQKRSSLLCRYKVW